MTEAEWEVIDDVRQMCSFLGTSGASTRKLRLFSCACCRRVWDYLIYANTRQAIEITEQYVDGSVDRGTLDATHSKLMAFVETLPVGDNPPQSDVMAAWAVAFITWWDRTKKYGDAYVAEQVANMVAGAAGAAFGDKADWTTGYATEIWEYRAAARLLRDIFGNPFRPIAFSPSWRTSTAVTLASQMYESRDFGAMPILADALQDAGCDSTDVLAHCRTRGDHVRGCWVADLVLGKQ